MENRGGKPSNGGNRRPRVVGIPIRFERIGSLSSLHINSVHAGRALLTFTFDELLQHGLQGDLSFLRAGRTVFELDPAFIEAIQHTNSWCGVPHALRSEERLPSCALHRFRPHGTAKDLS